MSASTGGRTMPSEIASAMETISSAPFLCDNLGDGGNVFNRRRKSSATAPARQRSCRSTAAFKRRQVEAAVLADSQLSTAACPGVARRCASLRGIRDARSGDHDSVASGDADGHHHRFGSAGRAVVHGSVGDIHAGQLADHGLEFEDGLQRSLRDLRLVRRVGGEELAALDQRINDDRAVMAIGAGAQKAGVAGCVVRGAFRKWSTISDSAICRGMFEIARSGGIPRGWWKTGRRSSAAPICCNISVRSPGDFGK